MKKVILTAALCLTVCLSGCGPIVRENTTGSENAAPSSQPTAQPSQTTEQKQPDASASDRKPSTEVEIPDVDGLEVQLNVSSKALTFDGQQPIAKDGEVLVPVYGVFENLTGAHGNTDAPFTVQWDESNSTATIQNSWYTVVVTQGKQTFTCKGKGLDDKSIKSAVPPQMINGTLMLPLKAIAEAITATVEWDESTGTVSMYYKPMIKTN